MAKAKLAVGDKVACKKMGSLKHDFEGTLEKLYDNSGLVSITKYDDEDRIAVSDYHERVVIAQKNMKKIS